VTTLVERSLESLLSRTQDPLQALHSSGNDAVRARIAHFLGNHKSDAASFQAVSEILLDSANSDQLRLAAAEAVRRMAGAEAVRSLVQATETGTPEVRAVAVTEMGLALQASMNTEEPTDRLNDNDRRQAIRALVRRLISIEEVQDVRDRAVQVLGAIDAGDEKVAALINEVTSQGLLRGQLDATAAVKALRATGFGEDSLLVEHLIGRAIDADGAVRGVIAELLIASAQRNVLMVGDRIKSYQKKHAIADANLQELRIEIGGATALSPLLRILQQDLHTYFQQPIYKLNEDTQAHWKDTIDKAGAGFRYRTIMSLIVFALGMALVAGSFVIFLTGSQHGASLWGPGVSFAGGLATVLLTVYTGPLKDIRQSVADVAAANAAYIGYIHAVLQISHTFSRQYLEGSVTFDEIEKSTKVIRVAMNSTVAALRDVRDQTDEPQKPESDPTLT
jgi:HEAT repeat protein